MMDVIKGIIIFAGYFALAPAAGLFLRNRLDANKYLYIALFVLLYLHIDHTVLMLGSIEWYRGVTKGYEFSMMEMMGITLLVANISLKDTKNPAFIIVVSLWALYVIASTLSIVSALNINYVLMSTMKFSKVFIIAAGVFYSIKNHKNLLQLCDGMAVFCILELLCVLKMKYVDGVYQVRGTFEHQNPLAIFTYMIAFPMISMSLSRKTDGVRSLVYFFAYLCCAFIILSSLSRAALAIFAVGSFAIVSMSILSRPTLRKVSISVLFVMAGAVASLFTLDTIISRFNDEGNHASGETRRVMNLASVAMYDDKVLGIGWNNFGKAINHPYPYGDVIDDWNRENKKKVDPDYKKGVVESHYYLLLAETGIQGLLTYIILIFALFLLNAWGIAKNRNNAFSPFLFGILVAFALVYAHSHLERVLTQTKNLALWVVYIGIIAAAFKPITGKNTES